MWRQTTIAQRQTTTLTTMPATSARQTASKSAWSPMTLSAKTAMKATNAARVRARRMPAFARGCCGDRDERLVLAVAVASSFLAFLSAFLAIIDLGRRAAPGLRGRGCSASADLRRRGRFRPSGCPSGRVLCPTRTTRPSARSGGPSGSLSSTRTSSSERQLPLVLDLDAGARDVDRRRVAADRLVHAAHGDVEEGIDAHELAPLDPLDLAGERDASASRCGRR